MATDVLKAVWTWRSAVASKESGLQSTTRFTLLVLSLWMNEKGMSAFPTVKTMAEASGLSERAICTHLELAVTAGWLTRKEHGYAGKKWRRNEYEAKIPGTYKAEPEPVDNSVENGQQGTERGSAPSTEGTERHTEGTERRSIELSISTPPSDKSEGLATNGGEKPEVRKKRAAQKTAIPENFGISDRVIAWANTKGYILTYLQDCLEAFTSNAKAKGMRYVDWDEAFMTWVRREKTFSRQPPPTASQQPAVLDPRCAWTNRGTEPRCQKTEGTIQVNAKDCLCLEHHTIVLKKIREKTPA